MGKADRLRIKQIIDGRTPPIHNQEVKITYRNCGKCHARVAESLVRKHIRECWRKDIKDDEPIPTEYKAKKEEKL